MKISGIYKIQSKIKPERIYIGSAVDIKKRWGEHLCELRKGKHYNSRIQRHFSKYGESDFIFSIIVACDKENLTNQEQFFMDSLCPYFNLSPTAGNVTGYRHTPEMIAWFSETRKGKKLSAQHIESLKKAQKGRVLSEETKVKISKSHIGLGHTEETRKKLSESHKGKIVSEETRKKLSLAGMGRKPSEETRRKLSAANMGHGISEETREKLRKASTGKPFPESARRKLSVALKNKKKSDETRAKMSKSRLGIEPWNKGMKMNEEHRKKLSIAFKLAWAKRKKVT